MVPAREATTLPGDTVTEVSRGRLQIDTAGKCRRETDHRRSRLMRFAIQTGTHNTTWADLRAVWQEADGIELFESGWVCDHFYPVDGDSAGPCLESWTLLTALAQATHRLRFGVLVSGAHYRHPAVLANMAATVDVISGGRLELGIGGGWNEEESSAYGIRLGTARERSDRLEEACQVLVSLLSQPVADFDGRFYQLTGARCEPKGVQRPHPPICIGGNGERRTLRTAAKYAQHWNFMGGTPEQFARKRDVLFQHCQDVGRDPAEIMLSSHVRLYGDNVGAVADDAAAMAAEGMQLAMIWRRPPLTPAVLEPLAEALAPLATDAGLGITSPPPSGQAVMTARI
jgi:F420-dependent oxidoreductase-like protein